MPRAAAAPKATDDVEGHAGRPRADRYEADDGDGMTRPLEAGSDAVLPSDEDDVEGHRAAKNAPDSDDQDDVEGHRAAKNAPDSDDQDDVEGRSRTR
jgi:hypothetical protein